MRYDSRMKRLFDNGHRTYKKNRNSLYMKVYKNKYMCLIVSIIKVIF